MKQLAIETEHVRKHASAESDSVAHDRLEHRLHVGRRGADHAKYRGSCRLLLQCLSQLARARLHLVEQAHVLDRDHGLVGEGRDQLDLLLGERPDDAPRQADHADHRIPAQQRHAEHGSPVSLGLRLEPGELGVLEHVGDVHASCLRARSGRLSLPARGRWGSAPRTGGTRRRPRWPRPSDTCRPTSSLKMTAQSALAEAGGGGDDRVQHRLQLGGRAADDTAALRWSRSAARALRAVPARAPRSADTGCPAPRWCG